MRTNDFLLILGLTCPDLPTTNDILAPVHARDFLQRLITPGTQQMHKQRQERLGRWNHFVCNTSNHRGCHWVLIVYRLEPYAVHILDPYAHTKYSDGLGELLAPLADSPPQLRGMGHQPSGDQWRCGYIALWWHVFCHHHITNEFMPESSLLPARPVVAGSEWEDFCLNLLNQTDAAEQQRQAAELKRVVDALRHSW